MTIGSNKIMKIVDGFDSLPIAECRESFDKLESELFKLPQLKDEDYSLKESYSGGLYARQITIKAGALITGRIYRFDHIEIMLEGDIVILSADGTKNRYTGFNTIEAKSGKRQAGLALKDTTWTTLCRVPEDIPMSEMLDYTSVLTYEEYNQFYRDVNNADYKRFLFESKITQDQIDKMVKVDDVSIMGDEYSHIYTKNSKLDGVGLFSKKDINKGDIICPSRIGNKRTIAGRYSNHALYANSYPSISGDEFCMIAKTNIMADEEITSNYREVLDFRFLKGDLLCQVG